jgi:hypothetical protein
METIGGNFFESVPTGADAYLLRWILHDWAEMEAAAILGSLRRAMKPTARLILVENVIPEGGVSLRQVDRSGDVGLSRRTRTNRNRVSGPAHSCRIRSTGSGCYSFAAEPPCCKTSVAREQTAGPSTTLDVEPSHSELPIFTMLRSFVLKRTRRSDGNKDS